MHAEDHCDEPNGRVGLMTTGISDWAMLAGYNSFNCSARWTIRLTCPVPIDACLDRARTRSRRVWRAANAIGHAAELASFWSPRARSAGSLSVGSYRAAAAARST